MMFSTDQNGTKSTKWHSAAWLVEHGLIVMGGSSVNQ